MVGEFISDAVTMSESGSVVVSTTQGLTALVCEPSSVVQAVCELELGKKMGFLDAYCLSRVFWTLV